MIIYTNSKMNNNNNNHNTEGCHLSNLIGTYLNIYPTPT